MLLNSLNTTGWSTALAQLLRQLVLFTIGSRIEFSYPWLTLFCLYIISKGYFLCNHFQKQFEQTLMSLESMLCLHFTYIILADLIQVYTTKTQSNHRVGYSPENTVECQSSLDNSLFVKVDGKGPKVTTDTI